MPTSTVVRARRAGWRAVLAACGLAVPHLAWAQAVPQPGPEPFGNLGTPVTVLPNVDVVGSTPLLGTGISRDLVPAETQVFTPQDIARQGLPNALQTLSDQAAGVNLDSASGNPYQPTLFYHGFEASPLQGTPQGIAVYVNGVRFNQPFGDTVNWDLIPDIAIDRMNLEGSNPVYGLNALGGSLSVQMKNGFTYHGAEFDASGGSFGQVQGQFQYGKQVGDVSTYIAGDVLREEGWRDLQSSNLYNFFGDIGWRGEQGEVHLDITAADTTLNGPGTSPVELLAVDPAAQFTGPNQISNQYLQVNLNGTYDVNDTTSLQAVSLVPRYSSWVVTILR
ncbi:MAG TPA: TonB-dependent receptor [Acetobacteraceae bacterium]|nr:TonB-dependent receptor [Acetobacteraceae bacterium]